MYEVIAVIIRFLKRKIMLTHKRYKYKTILNVLLLFGSLLVHYVFGKVRMLMLMEMLF